MVDLGRLLQGVALVHLSLEGCSSIEPVLTGVLVQLLSINTFCNSLDPVSKPPERGTSRTDRLQGASFKPPLHVDLLQHEAFV